MNRHTDHSLVRYIRDGDENAAAEIYTRYARRLRIAVADRVSPEYAVRFDPEDILQSVFRIFYEGVRSRMYDVPREGEMWGLLFVLAVNKLRDQTAFHRAEKRNVYRTAGLPLGGAEAVFSSDEETATFLRLIVEEYLGSLPESDRDVVALRMTGHEVAEISSQTRRARRTVERILQKSRDQLARILDP